VSKVYPCISGYGHANSLDGWAIYHRAKYNFITILIFINIYILPSKQWVEKFTEIQNVPRFKPWCIFAIDYMSCVFGQDTEPLLVPSGYSTRR